MKELWVTRPAGGTTHFGAPSARLIRGRKMPNALARDSTDLRREVLLQNTLRHASETASDPYHDGWEVMQPVKKARISRSSGSSTSVEEKTAMDELLRQRLSQLQGRKSPVKRKSDSPLVLEKERDAQRRIIHDLREVHRGRLRESAANKYLRRKRPADAGKAEPASTIPRLSPAALPKSPVGRRKQTKPSPGVARRRLVKRPRVAEGEDVLRKFLEALESPPRKRARRGTRPPTAPGRPARRKLVKRVLSEDEGDLTDDSMAPPRKRTKPTRGVKRRRRRRSGEEEEEEVPPRKRARPLRGVKRRFYGVGEDEYDSDELEPAHKRAADADTVARVGGRRGAFAGRKRTRRYDRSSSGEDEEDAPPSKVRSSFYV